MQYGLITSPECKIYSGYMKNTDEVNTTGIEDEIFSGWAVMYDDAKTVNGWAYITTHNGYSGYINSLNMKEITKEELVEYQDKNRFHRICRYEADVYDAPKVSANPLEMVLKNGIVEVLENTEDGWSKIKTAAGCEGYVHSVFLTKRLDDDGFLLGTPILLQAGNAYLKDEWAFRKAVVKSAKAYLGTQYRWGGKSSQGVDCSGLVCMSYMENGYLIYRDAKVMDGFPVRAIDRKDMKEGDLLFFPGHVAMYIGNNRYIHSTGFAKSSGVVINSLNPQDEDYRQDLDEKMTMAGTVFAETSYDNGFDAIEKQLSQMEGNVSFYYKNLANGREYGYRQDAPHIAASVIKLTLMAVIFDMFEKKELSRDTLITVERSKCVPSCGVLSYMSENPKVTIRDLVEFMIIVSDNTATNLLFDLAGEERINAFISKEIGLENTSFNRKMFDALKAAKGIENYISAKDAAVILEKIYKGELVSKEASKEMYQILSDQRLNGKIPFLLHNLDTKVKIAHKTGEDTKTTHDVAIIEGKNPFIVCFLGNDTKVAEFERFMADTALMIYERENG